jgi:hypothetical protein
MRVEYGDGQDATSVSVATAAARASDSDEAQAHGQKAILRQCQLAIAATKESCGAALN